VLIISIDGSGIGGDQCSHRFNVAAPTRFMDRYFGHNAPRPGSWIA
jgi:hypothetical protein